MDWQVNIYPSEIPDLHYEIGRCRELLDSGLLDSDGPCRQSALIEILIRIDFVLNNCGRFGIKKPAWREHTRNNEKICDVINKLRDAVCHSESFLNKWQSATMKFNVFHGTAAIQWGEEKFGGEFADDVAFNYGNRIIYLQRHIVRIIEFFENEFQKKYANKH